MGDQLTHLLERAAGIEQAIHALAHLPVDVGQDPAPGSRGRFQIPRFLAVSHVDPGACHRFHHTVVFQLAVDLADRVAMQSGLHGQLTGAGQPVARRVVPGCDCKTDLVVELGGGRDLAFLLDMESHAGLGQIWVWPPYEGLVAVTIVRLAHSLAPGLLPLGCGCPPPGLVPFPTAHHLERVSHA